MFKLGSLVLPVCWHIRKVMCCATIYMRPLISIQNTVLNFEGLFLPVCCHYRCVMCCATEFETIDYWCIIKSRYTGRIYFYLFAGISDK